MQLTNDDDDDDGAPRVAKLRCINSARREEEEAAPSHRITVARYDDTTIDNLTYPIGAGNFPFL